MGVFQSIRPRGILDNPEVVSGAALETLVIQEVRATVSNMRLPYDLFHWRTSNGTEVDLVLYGKRGLVAMEVKQKRKLQPGDLNGLKAFLSDYPTAKAFLIYGGAEKRHFGKIRALPAEEALRNLVSLL